MKRPPPTKSIERKRKIYDEIDESLFSILAKYATPEINSNSQIKPMDKDVITLIDIIGCPRNEKKIMLQLGYLSTIQDVLLALLGSNSNSSKVLNVLWW